jgi:hypothetical protein
MPLIRSGKIRQHAFSKLMRDKKQLSPENQAVAVTEDLLKLGRKAFYSETFGNEVFQKDGVGALDSPINPVTLENSSTKFTQRPMNPV